MRKFISTFLAFTCLSFHHMSGQETVEQIVYRPIGIFHTPYTPETGAPRQGILEPDVKGKIELFPEYHDALESLDLYEHIIVLYHFSKVQGWSSTARPPGTSDEIEFGLFATRTPRRPNPIGITVMKLDKVENGILYISGPDAFDGTPVLDIKPYIPSLDCVESSGKRPIEMSPGM